MTSYLLTQVLFTTSINMRPESSGHSGQAGSWDAKPFTPGIMNASPMTNFNQISYIGFAGEGCHTCFTRVFCCIYFQTEMSHESYLTHLYGLWSGPWSLSISLASDISFSMISMQSRNDYIFFKIADILLKMAGPMSKLSTKSLDETFWSLK